MKKSEIYYLAQVAVVSTATIAPENKMEVLRELMSAEDCYKTVENSKALQKGVDDHVE